MKSLLKNSIIVILCAGLLPGLVSSCKKEKRAPTVETALEITGITQTSAISGGNVTDDGGSVLKSKGVCWSVKTGPTTINRVTNNGTDPGAFVSTLTDLTPGNRYYVRAYATNDIGTSYGQEITFTTNPLGIATLTTPDVTSINRTSALSGGAISSDGGAQVTEKGVCYGTASGPDVSGNHTSDGSGDNSFTSQITGLTPGTRYYVRAFATNSVGTAYGNEVSFTTLLVAPPILTTTGVTTITSATALSGGNVTDENGSSVTARGVCWSKRTNPTLSDSFTVDGSGPGSFTSSLTGLEMAETYYVRAYATNNEGTSYGNVQSFTTKLEDAGGNLYNIVNIGTQTWMAENLKTTKYNDNTDIPYAPNKEIWASMLSPGFCWYDYNESDNKDLYGGLYNFYAVNTGKLCPDGWHIPYDSEWAKLTSYLGGALKAGGPMKTTGTIFWKTPNEGATNESGFSALPGGYCISDGTFGNLGSEGYFWTGSGSLYRMVDYSSTRITSGEAVSAYGLSVRCMKDE